MEGAGDRAVHNSCRSRLLWRVASRWRYAGRRWLLDLAAGIWCPLMALLLVVVLRWAEPKSTGRGPDKRPLSRRVVAGALDLEISFSPRGELELDNLQFQDCFVADLHLGSIEAASGSSSAPAPSLLSLQMVVGRPLPPCSSASVLSGRQTTALFNLKADLPTRRLFCFTIVCFRRLIPSGSVPGDVSVDYGEKLWRGGEEAGPDCVF